MPSKIEKLSGEIGKQMRAKKLTLVTAESCTGGGVAYYISKNPESSPLLERGLVTYSNSSKEELLNVKPYSLQTHGAVSEEVALEMAEGALKNSAAQVSLAITGIAGPDKEEGEKKQNQGLVWICCASTVMKPRVEKKFISGSRSQFIDKVIVESLTILSAYLDPFESKVDMQE